MKRIGLTIAFVVTMLVFPQRGFAVFSAPGYYENTDTTNITYTGSWSVSANTNASGGSSHLTTSVGAIASFQVSNADYVIVWMYGDGSDAITVCVNGGSCFNSAILGSTGRPMPVPVTGLNGGTDTITVQRANLGGIRIFLDAVQVIEYTPTETPIPTQTGLPIPLPVTFAPNYPTPPPYLTQIPYPTPLPTNTGLPLPLPVTFDPGNFPTPLPTNTAYLYPTPLATWTPQAFSIDWSGFPTPLDTWTPAAAAVIEVTLQGTFIASVPTFDPAVLGTYFPTLAPTATPTPSITPGASPTETPSLTPTPPGEVLIEIPDAEGTPVATGVFVMRAEAGDVMVSILLIGVLVSTITGSILILRKPTR